MDEHDDILDSLFEEPKKASVKPARPDNYSTGRPTVFSENCADIVRRTADMHHGIAHKIADILGISQSTVYEWAKKDSDFSEAISESKARADDLVVSSALKNAIGYNYEEERIVVVNGKAERFTITRHKTASDNMIQFWLQNRRGDEWTRTDQKTVDVNINLPDRLSLAKQRARDALPKPVDGPRVFDQEDDDR